jgi:hypothetical protein
MSSAEAQRVLADLRGTHSGIEIQRRAVPSHFSSQRKSFGIGEEQARVSSHVFAARTHGTKNSERSACPLIGTARGTASSTFRRHEKPAAETP